MEFIISIMSPCLLTTQHIQRINMFRCIFKTVKLCKSRLFMVQMRSIHCGCTLTHLETHGLMKTSLSREHLSPRAVWTFKKTETVVMNTHYPPRSSAFPQLCKSPAGRERKCHQRPEKKTPERDTKHHRETESSRAAPDNSCRLCFHLTAFHQRAEMQTERRGGVRTVHGSEAYAPHRIYFKDIWFTCSFVVTLRYFFKYVLLPTQAHWKYVSLHTFLQHRNYVPCNTFRGSFKVKCPESGAKTHV